MVWWAECYKYVAYLQKGKNKYSNFSSIDISNEKKNSNRIYKVQNNLIGLKIRVDNDFN